MCRNAVFVVQNYLDPDKVTSFFYAKHIERVLKSGTLIGFLIES